MGSINSPIEQKKIMMDNINLLTSSTFLHLGKANEFALLSVYETSSAFSFADFAESQHNSSKFDSAFDLCKVEVLSASCCLSYSPLNRAPLVVLRNAIESHRLSSYSKSQEMNL